MSIIDTLVTNRTQADVSALAAALARCSAGTGTLADLQLIRSTASKGAYSCTDLNRVGAALAYVAGRLNAEAGAALRLSPKTDWAETDEPAASRLAYYLQMVRTVRDALAAAPSTPAAPERMAGLTAAGANAIEQILVDLDGLITNMTAAFRHCGVPRCGTTGGLMR